MANALTGLGNSFGGLAGAFSKAGMLFFQAVLGFGLLGALYWFVLRKYIEFNYDVTVWKKRGNSLIKEKDRARIKRDKDGKVHFKFYSKKRNKACVDIPDFDAMMSNAKGKPNIYLYQYGEMSYGVCKITPDALVGKVKLEVIEPAIVNIMRNEQQAIKAKYDRIKGLAAIAVPLSVGIMGIMMIVLFVVIRKYAC